MEERQKKRKKKRKTCHVFQHGRPLILEILNFIKYSYFTKIMTRKPKIGNLTNMTELYPFLESKVSAISGDFVVT